MASPYRLGVALTELAHAEKAAIGAQSRLAKLVANSAATPADTAAFLVIATQLFAAESSIYGQITGTLAGLPTEVTAPILAQLPAPALLATPGATTSTPATLGNPAAAAAVPWALIVLAVLLAVVVAVAIVWTITISIETVANIILTYKQADAYADALQRRIDCVNRCVSAGQPLAACTTSCNSSVVLPPPPTPPQPPTPANPNLPWYIGGTIVGGLGALGLVGYFLERRAK